MIRGIYTSASGMIAEAQRTDVIANNLANVDTTGFKKDVAVDKDFASVLIQRVNDGAAAPTIGAMGSGVVVDEIAPIYTQGPDQLTGNMLDVAIEGSGYFAVQTPNGVRYTRNGAFSKNLQGQLVTGDGYPVLGENGPINLSGDNGAGKVTISSDGQVTVDGMDVDRLRMTQFANEKQLQKEGYNLFAAQRGAQTEPFAGQVHQEMLEKSNVSAITEMVNLIACYRAYETNARSVTTQDTMLGKAVNDVGKV